MTFPKGYSPLPGPPGGSSPSSPSGRKGHGGAIAGVVILIVFIVVGISVYSATRPHPIPSSTSLSSTVEPNSPVATDSPSTTQPSSIASQSSNCDPSYPDFCIPPPPPDLNCADISQKRFTVSGADPHGFDRDGDGIGCES